MSGEHHVATERIASHTPAPWVWWTSNSWKRLRHERLGFGSSIIEPYVCRDGHPDLTVKEADMHLIAAAPELLAALKEMGDWIAAGLQASDEAWPDARCLQHTEEIAARARAAVAKAEGRS